MPQTEQIGFKALEADFFLRKMHAASAELFEFRCYFSAFASAARGIPVSMEAGLGARPEYPGWRVIWQQRLEANRIARFFAALRIETQRIGHTPVHLDRSRWVRFGLWETKHHFTRDEGVPGDVPDLDVLEACTEYLSLLAEMVLDCYEKFGIRSPAPLWSVPALARLGVTVDDIEDSLGFPRGWTAGDGRDDRARLAALRRYSPDTPLDRFFLRYLNRARAAPADG
ncbi:MAG: hypothetical protein ACKVZ0_06130 [Gemmatimonadales bacterium]